VSLQSPLFHNQFAGRGLLFAEEHTSRLTGRVNGSLGCRSCECFGQAFSRDATGTYSSLRQQGFMVLRAGRRVFAARGASGFTCGGTATLTVSGPKDLHCSLRLADSRHFCWSHRGRHSTVV